MELLAQIVFPVPFGVFFLTDLHNRRPAPDWDRTSQIVAGTEAAIRVRTVTSRLGLADIRVSRGRYDGDSELVYDGALELRFGRLLVTDANDENALVIGVEPGRCPVRIHADPTPSPHRVDIVLDQP